eukprot:CAMPEP_0113559648 /NCGR_PEP_ID=MMETSP0015_2-20120614/19010_1 /TAXON_ID=2838 /ORGANISM="Odontella" /LENGTH=263 /DNA_ID=CAMNT_0000461301 /DNA_START=420 /DNA_END=1208 /DNA_ORIENTATION=- /assembly_acc=CAM_ASM_000160
MAEFAVTFAAGAFYGLTTVVVGQPLDTIKVRMQGMPNHSTHSAFSVAKELFSREGVRGLYRGGLPLFLGGSLMRSAQFGVSGKARDVLRQWGLPDYRLFGLFDYQIVLAGIAGGIGRGLVEAPTDFFKTRRQVEKRWELRHVLDGTGVTLARNTVLYAAFMVYVDLSKQACAAHIVPSILTTPDGMSLTPFAKGAICANLAWLTVWPADVVKTQRQSGNYDINVSSWKLLMENVKSGRMFRGVVPGLVRSSIANGSSMVVYEW